MTEVDWYATPAPRQEGGSERTFTTAPDGTDHVIVGGVRWDLPPGATLHFATYYDEPDESSTQHVVRKAMTISMDVAEFGWGRDGFNPLTRANPS